MPKQDPLISAGDYLDSISPLIPMKIRRQSSLIRGHLVRLAISTALITAALQAHAAIRAGESSPEAVAQGVTPELMLVIWDPVKEISYVKDLGINVYKEYYSSGNTSTNLFVYGQQDSGYQKLFDPLNADTNFQTFLSKSTDVANQIWAVVAYSINSEIPVQEFGTSIYTTLNSAASPGTLNPQYTNLLNSGNSNWANAAALLGTGMGRLNIQAGSCSGACATDYEVNRSYVNTKGQLAYADTMFGANGLMPTAAAGAPNIFNKINKSSWFYATTTTSDDGSLPIAVDEFDNLGHDAYWGLGVDSNGNYILSYTMEASLTQAQTAQGQMLRLRTDFAANYGGTRFIGAPAGDTLNLGGGTTITPVPEPSTWGLMGLGLALLAGRARRQKNA